jgi:hypothetical protein
MREPPLDIHQAEGGADVYWRGTGAPFEGACAVVVRWRLSRADLGHGAGFGRFMAFVPKRAKNQGLSGVGLPRIA